jgi:hypothetical protein
VRRIPVLFVVVLAAACGGTTQHAAAPQQPYRHFVSRPDLQPTRVAIRKELPGTAPGYIFIAPKRGKTAGPMIMDDNGQVVWFHPVQPKQATDFRVQQYRGKPVLTWWGGGMPVLGVGRGKYVIADESYRTIAEIRPTRGLWYDLHEFQLTPRGTALFTAYHPTQTRVAGSKVWVLDSIVSEVDVASRRVVFRWHSLPHVAPTESELPIPKKTSAKQPFDYFHVNSVDLDTDGNFIVSGRNTSAVYKIRRSDGAVLWRLGGKKSDFSQAKGVSFHWQHDALRNPDGTITIFDNDAMPPRAKMSRALVLDVNEDAKTAQLVRSYSHPARLLSPHQGNVQELPNGDVFVGWGGVPYFSEFTRDGRVLFDAKLAVGDTYRAYRFPWTGRPTEPPAIALRDNTVYASWNGATEVARWQVLGGSSRHSLHPLAGTPRSGFETAIPFDGKPRFVAVRALDASGRVLGRSHVVVRS